MSVDGGADQVPDLDRFKSVFARSVAINSRRTTRTDDPCDAEQRCAGSTDREVIRLRQECQNLVEENRRLNSSRRGRIVSCDVQLPVENFVLQSQVDTLRWQLEQTESSLGMYKAVMEQMVLFLERTHRSLDLLAARLTVGTKQSSRSNCSVPRSFSVHHVSPPNSRLSESTARAPDAVPRSRSVVHVPGTSDSPCRTTRASVLRSRSVHHVCPERDTPDKHHDTFTWKKSTMLEHPSPDEIPPEKLSHEAFRLLRTARSLLEATGPKLQTDCQKTPDPDAEFLRQLAREFPAKPTPNESNVSVSVAVNRKLNLAATKQPENEYCFMAPARDFKPRRNSIAHYPSSTPVSSVRRPGSETGFLNRHRIYQKTDDPTAKQTDLARLRSKFFEDLKQADKTEPVVESKVLDEFTNAKTVAGSVSSAEDESGFSSMSSFQEVGVPVYDKQDDEDAQEVNRSAIETSEPFGETCDDLTPYRGIGVPVYVEHRRWSSTPVDATRKDPLTVLWV